MKEEDKIQDVLPTNYRILLKNFIHDDSSDDSFYANFYSGEQRRAIDMNLQANKWATGYVPMFHSRMNNTKIGPRVSDIIANKVVDDLVRIEGKDIPEEQTDTMSKTLDEQVLTENVEAATYSMLGRGQVLLRATYNTGKPLGLTIFPLPRYKALVDGAGNVIEAWMYISRYSTKEFEEYVLAEHRFVKDGKFFSESKIITARWSNVNAEDFTFETIEKVEPGKISGDVYKRLENEGIQLDRPIQIAFMGCYLVNNKYNAKMVYSGIGESQFVNAMEAIARRDVSSTYESLDEYLGKGQVLIPQMLSTTNPMPQFGGGNVANMNAMVGIRNVNPLDKTMFKQIESFSMAEQRPTVFQNEIRADQWKLKQDEQLSEIAAACGISAIDLDPSISNGVYRNDNEVDSQTDKTKATVKTVRKHLSFAYNKMLNDVAAVLGLNQTFFVRWSYASISNTKANDDLAINRYNSGIQSLEETLKQIHPDWKKTEIDEEMQRLQAKENSKNIEDTLTY